METLVFLFNLSVGYTLIALVIYVLMHGYALIIHYTKGPDSKMSATSFAAFQVYGFTAAIWPILIALLAKGLGTDFVRYVKNSLK